MTKEELIKELREAAISEEQIALVCEYCNEYPSIFKFPLYNAEDWDEVLADSNKNFEDYKAWYEARIFDRADVLEEIFPIMVPVVKNFIKSQTPLGAEEIMQEAALLTPLTHAIGSSISAPILGILQHDHWRIDFDTILIFGISWVVKDLEALDSFPADDIDDANLLTVFLVASLNIFTLLCTTFEDVMRSRASYCEICNRISNQVEFIKSVCELEESHPDHQRKSIAAAIRKLQQTGNDKEQTFFHKYQWCGIFNVMSEYNLLNDKQAATFCRICNNPKSPAYFLPDDHYTLNNPYVPGKSDDKESTWNQLISHNKNTETKKKNTEKTEKEFILLLKDEGVIE